MKMYKIIFFILLFLLVCGFIYYFTFCKYPELIYGIVTKTSGYDASADKLGRGTYGDMYGALNTFFSGIAFLGLLVTIGVQIYIHNEERKNDNEKRDEERINNQNKQNKTFQDSLHYINCLFIDAIGITNNHKESFEIFIANKEKNVFNNDGFKVGSFVSRLNTITEKIDQEKYFIAYRNFFNDYDIIPVFENFTMIQKACELGIDQITQYQSGLRKSVDFFELNLSAFFKEYNRLLEIEPTVLITLKNTVDNILEKLKFQESNLILGFTDYTPLKEDFFELNTLVYDLFYEIIDDKLDVLMSTVSDIVNQYSRIENSQKILISSLKDNISVINIRKISIESLIEKLDN